MSVAAGISAAMAMVTAGKVATCLTTAHMTTATANMAATTVSISDGRSQRQGQRRSAREKDIS